MQRYDHLKLVRIPESLGRRKTGGGGKLPARAGGHAPQLRKGLDEAIERMKSLRPPQFVDPSLILRVRMDGMTMEEDWAALGLTLLESDDDRTLVLFASSDDMADFRARLAAYEGPIPKGQKYQRFVGFINRIESFGNVEPSDRIGIRLREEGFNEPSDLLDDQSYMLDVEIWDLGVRALRERKIEEIEAFIEEHKGEKFDRYIGPSITMLRVKVDGATAQKLLTIPEISTIDLPPAPDLETKNILDIELGDLPEVEPVDPEAPIVAILDSGINKHPLLDDVLVDELSFPEELGTADEHGHGTRVGGVAVFGDIRNQLAAGRFTKSVRLVSAKIVDDQGNFYQRRTLPTQMTIAITQLNRDYGCRIFVISLGDKRANKDGRVGPWAATLDELARELNVLIIVSAGNRAPRGGARVEQAVTEYPDYLLESSNRIFEPAGAINVLTAGSLAHGNGIGPEHEEDAHVQPIAQAFEPSPFTRIGPGADGAMKPDIVDLGGTMIYDAGIARLRKAPDVPTTGLLTLNSQFITQLFSSGAGTSFSAPLVAQKAGYLLRRYPTLSANLLRALLVGAASVPEESVQKLVPIDATAVEQICGNGVIDAQAAANSDDHRVILVTEDELDIDHFAVYRVPVPELFQKGGRRTIQVTLAFDPPVRHSRADYMGIGMSFRLIRGQNKDFIFEHYRARTKKEEDFPKLPKKYDCKLKPGSTKREKCSVQTASVSFTKDTDEYGDEYFLVVRCNGGWASEQEVKQRFALVVELKHEAQVQLYSQLRARVRV